MVAMSTVPVRTPVISDGSAARRNPFCKIEMENRPKSVPQMVPRPPKTDVPPKHHGGDRGQLIAGAGVGLGLAQVRNIDDGGDARNEAGKKI